MKQFLTLAAATILTVTTHAANTRKPAQKTTAQVETQEQASAPTHNTQTSTYSGKPTAFSTEAIKGLGVYVGYDTTDTLDIKDGVNADIDRGFTFAAQYDFAPINTGMYFSTALTFTPAREISNSNGAKLSNIAPSALFNVVLAPKFGMNAGLNYNFPKLSGAGSLKAKNDLGYQFGATFFASQSVNIDVTYKVTKIKLSSDYDSTKAEMAGLNLGARYMF